MASPPMPSPVVTPRVANSGVTRAALSCLIERVMGIGEDWLLGAVSAFGQTRTGAPVQGVGRQR